MNVLSMRLIQDDLQSHLIGRLRIVFQVVTKQAHYLKARTSEMAHQTTGDAMKL